MTYEWYDEDGNKMKCQKSEYTITKNNEEEVYICVVTDQNERLRNMNLRYIQRQVSYHEAILMVRQVILPL